MTSPSALTWLTGIAAAAPRDAARRAVAPDRANCRYVTTLSAQLTRMMAA